ncbi:MAG: hypothetical protein GOP50_11305 [Candidatus Heimdallarchaeota archaeon]|nr:hypothetical protein [Candidatus Heimdallarchaeota archaeon]
MSSYSLVQENLLDLGLVSVKFDLQLGPMVMNNHSDLPEDLLMKLAIKGTSTLMNGLGYDFSNSRRFRGLFQLSEDYFVYGFDLVLIDDQGDEGGFSPVILFLVFPTKSLPLIGSNIRSIEETIYQSTRSFLTLSNMVTNFDTSLLFSIQDILAR